jgi:DNA-binding IclR family transcriptional regulator
MVAETSETATLSVRQGWSRVYVDQVLSPQEVRMWVTLGKAYPLHAGSSSKAILAALSDREVDQYLTEHGLESLTTSTISSREELKAEIESIRARGYASSSGERRADAGSVAAPILQAGGQVFGSISICGPITRFDKTAIRRYGALVKEAAAKLSADIGYLG